jgi:predicted component of type VI protein secretion system
LSLQKKVYISNLRNLTRKMRLIISADKPKAQLIEGIQSNVESILNTSQIE